MSHLETDFCVSLSATNVCQDAAQWKHKVKLNQSELLHTKGNRGFIRTQLRLNQGLDL